MSFPTVTINHLGTDVEVTCTKLGETPNHSYKFTAKVGDVVYEHSMTVGPVDGDFILPTAEQLQRDVDAARGHAARHAHMRHHVKQLEAQIK